MKAIPVSEKVYEGLNSRVLFGRFHPANRFPLVFGKREEVGSGEKFPEAIKRPMNGEALGMGNRHLRWRRFL
jgi:hypothetical protein